MPQRERSSENLRSTTASDLAALDAQLDFHREARAGIPEIVLAGVKSDEQIFRITHAFLDRTGRALLTRLRPETTARLAEEFIGLTIDTREIARAAALYVPEYERPDTGGRIGVLTAGT